MNRLKISESEYPGLYQSANRASLKSQREYYIYLMWYLLLLTLAAAASFQWPANWQGSLFSAFLFQHSLYFLIPR